MTGRASSSPRTFQLQVVDGFGKGRIGLIAAVVDDPCLYETGPLLHYMVALPELFCPLLTPNGPRFSQVYFALLKEGLGWEAVSLHAGPRLLLVCVFSSSMLHRHLDSSGGPFGSYFLLAETEAGWRWALLGMPLLSAVGFVGSCPTVY